MEGRDEKGRIVDGKAVGNTFSSENQPANRPGRPKEYFKAALQKIADAEGQMTVGQPEILGLIDVQEKDGKPILTIRGEWATAKEGENELRVAVIVVKLPDPEAIAAQWYRDAKSRQANVRMRSRETLAERLDGKAAQPIKNEEGETFNIGLNSKEVALEMERFKALVADAEK